MIMKRKVARLQSAHRVLVAALCAASMQQLSDAAPAAKDRFTPAQKRYWAFQKVVRPPVPDIAARAWARNPVDHFIVAKLAEKGIAPSPETDRITLLRRVTLDLIGLPPTPEETRAFLEDESPEAYEKVVDRLLASPAYGERWARHWLDLARYAESDGFADDLTRPNAWRYRDYVIQSFSQDKPYDRFIQEQIAGDELWPDSLEARLATAFNRHYSDQPDARFLFTRRQETLNDITDTVGSVFLGLTFECARCHDHKFDPILQADYYRLQAFFANVIADDKVVVLPPNELTGYEARLAPWLEKTKPIREKMEAFLAERRKRNYDTSYDKYSPDIQKILSTPDSELSPRERLIDYWANHSPHLVAPDDALIAGLKGEKKKEFEALRKELEQYKDLYPGDLPVGSAMVDLSRDAPPTHVLAGGVDSQPREEVQPGFLTILDPNNPKIDPPADGQSTGRRSLLAKWIASSDNPLAGRVMVNRLWHYHFGTGIVANPSDFGVMGFGASNPKLLDWLADEFVKNGWSLKKMHRLMVTSSTYRQSSAYRADAAKVDSGNRLLWRFPRQRLEGEAIRDSALFVAGLLNQKVGGPSVFPPLPPNITKSKTWVWETTPTVDQQNRRSVYIFVRRNLRYPMLEVMDMPDTQTSCARRQNTLTAPQALTMLNSDIASGWAQGFGARVLREARAGLQAQIERAYQLAYARPPTATEKDLALTFFNRHQKILARRVAASEKLALPAEIPAGVDTVEAAALVDFCLMLLNSNEFVYRN
jgi:hypothetical protein